MSSLITIHDEQGNTRLLDTDAARQWHPPGYNDNPFEGPRSTALPDEGLYQLPGGVWLKVWFEVYGPGYCYRELRPDEAVAWLVEAGQAIPQDLAAVAEGMLVGRHRPTPSTVPPNRGLEADPIAAEPETGDDELEGLRGLLRRLVEYMRGRREASLADVCKSVWSEDRDAVSDQAIRTACSKANNHLLRRRLGWQISKEGETLRRV